MEKQKPGPGTYGLNNVLTTGIASSTIQNPTSQRWARSKDRFYIRGEHQDNPPPTHYEPKHNMLDQSVMKSTRKTKFGKNHIDILDTVFHKRELKNVPGPGSYARFSDFN